ncbi:MAG TPA: HAMP domain-containing sensor histidine kinase [Acidimicrobiales bacterium]|nr:HAMP domain-containing sensor histidine kinase [Acidimicrobiales bacterium]
MRSTSSNRTHAARVAAVATALVMACYVIGVLVLNSFVVHRLTHEVDARLSTRLADANRLVLSVPPTGASRTNAAPRVDRGADLDDAPSFVWSVARSGAVTALTSGAPTLPRRAWSTAPQTLLVGQTQFRFEATRAGSGWLVVGQSVTEIQRVGDALWFPELIFGIALLLAVFAGALTIGLRALAPLELVRRRQAEFTADASHELRTPLTVIEAEVDLALSRRRDAEAYEAVLLRVADEGRRLRRIVDDLLWLARTDNEPAERHSRDTCDVRAVAAACTDRFQAVAEMGGVGLSFRQATGDPLVLQAPAEWIDRLISVLVDNACKYAGRGGRVEVAVEVTGNRVALRVDDSGPGVAAEQRPFIFDRFHRATESPGGAGLGLAIADSVVRATQGSWSVGRAPLGGARMEVWWRRSPARRGLSVPEAPIVGDDGPTGDPRASAEASRARLR